jgi:predicted O-linked N-acetylglucosamine transferase (SPINDLY family)
MDNTCSNSQVENLIQAAKSSFSEGRYSEAVELYDQLVSLQPKINTHYWYLGLSLLLLEQESEAQTVWLAGLSEFVEDVEGTLSLLGILKLEAANLETVSSMQSAWLVRRYIQEIAPDDQENLLTIIDYSASLGFLAESDELIYQAIDLIDKHENFNSDKLPETVGNLLENLPNLTSVIDFLEICIDKYKNPQQLANILFSTINSIQQNDFIPRENVIRLVHLCLRFSPQNSSVLINLISLYHEVGQYDRSIEYGKQLLEISKTTFDKISALYLLIKGFLLSGGEWLEAESYYQECYQLIQDLLNELGNIDLDQAMRLLVITGVSPYFSDKPSAHHTLRKRITQSSYANISKQSIEIKKRDRSNSFLRIGYISSCFRRHSVSWLSRWLLQYHDSEKFQIYAYSLKRTDDDLQNFVANQVHEFIHISSDATPAEIVERIQQDEVDILVDLDSITSKQICSVMMMKPAPIQVTWLGSDASGVPAIDYFIADQYVLPDTSQDYYTSKIWRLPHTYIAVDGFEASVPTLRRCQLNIPNDAVVFFSSQTGYKRHRKIVHLQMKILREVPDSFFLVRGLSDGNSVKTFFTEIAEQEGVSCKRLRFLPIFPSEEIHRANLQIADVVLDTYPYNGATTTLETLWMGIPLVTRVGEQFAARNSYAFMKNVGITEGIAWTDEEYIEWGIRLGTDESLRQKVAWQLRQSRHTSPLWDAEQFTCEMEDAYQQMWAKYIEQSS